MTVVAKVSAADARRLRLGRSVEVGRATRRLAARVRGASVVRLSRKARRAAAKDRQKLTVELTFTAVGSQQRAVRRRSVIIRR